MNIKWTTRFLNLAQEISSWSKDPSTKVGCVIVKGKNNIIQVGYNGYPPEIEDTLTDPREVKYQKTVHAEHNALRFAAENNIEVEGCTVYVTHLCCPDCMERLGEANISTVVYNSSEDNDFYSRWTQRHNSSKQIAKKYNISLVPVDIER